MKVEETRQNVEAVKTDQYNLNQAVDTKPTKREGAANGHVPAAHLDGISLLKPPTLWTVSRQGDNLMRDANSGVCITTLHDSAMYACDDCRTCATCKTCGTCVTCVTCGTCATCATCVVNC